MWPHGISHDLLLIVANIYTEQPGTLRDDIIYVITKQVLVFMKQTVEDFVLRMDLIVPLHMVHMTWDHQCMMLGNYKDWLMMMIRALLLVV